MASDLIGDFSDIREHILCLEPAAIAERRSVLWIDEGERLGVSRDPLGRVEIFITGAVLETRSRLIATNLTHDTWKRDAAQDLLANRLLLPNASHYDSVAAFICAELVENGLLTSPSDSFRRTEPVIELAIRRLALQEEVVVGLLGELILLKTLIERARNQRIGQILKGWTGHLRSARDLRLGAVGIEVKSTRGETSTHQVQGVHQVEVGHAHGGATETEFWLVSIGLSALKGSDFQGEAWTLPGVVDQICLRIEQAKLDDGLLLIADFLQRVLDYGAGESEGYNHGEMRHRIMYSQPWRISFVRAYDMTDPLVSVIRSSDLARVSMVDASSVEFTIVLPRRVNGDLNPSVGLVNVADALLSLAWSLPPT